MVVLGLVIEQPNQTVAHIAQMLDDRFPRAGFPKPTAYGALHQMARGQSARVRCKYTAPLDVRSMDRYVPTERGLKVYDSWMFQLPRAVPAMREAMYGRLELAKLEHLPRLIRIAREEELIAADMYALANKELRSSQEAKRRRRAIQKTPADYEQEIHATMLYVSPLHWSSRAEMFGLIGQRLEGIADEAGIEYMVPEKAGLPVEVSGG